MSETRPAKRNDLPGPIRSDKSHKQEGKAKAEPAETSIA